MIRLEPEAKRVIVGPKAALAVASASLRDINWIGGDYAGPVDVKVRSMAKPTLARLEGQKLQFHNPEFGVSPGQAAVFYHKERVLGGGWIDCTDAVEQQWLAGVEV